MIITPDQFEAEVLKSDKPVLVKFFVEKGCRFCEQYTPVFSAFEAAHPEIKCVEIGKPELKSQPDPIIAKYNPKDSYPTTVSFINGQFINKAGGVLNEEQLLQLLKTLQNISDEELMTQKFDLGVEIAKKDKEMFEIKNQALKVENEILRRQALFQTKAVTPTPLPADMPSGDPGEDNCDGCA